MEKHQDTLKLALEPQSVGDGGYILEAGNNDGGITAGIGDVMYRTLREHGQISRTSEAKNN